MHSASAVKKTFNPFFLFFFLLPIAPAAAQPGCLQTAADWIESLNSTRKEVLTDHARAKCDFAGNWMEKISDVAEQSKRERTCNDLVLIWTHKECIYFRDYIDDSAYDPCKRWTREMYRNCISNNPQWFAAE